MATIGLIWASSTNGVIGREGAIPWRLPEDLKRFKSMTSGAAVLMGRKTWESLPVKPLPGRDNIVLTSDASYVADGATVMTSFPSFVGTDGMVWVIGGEAVYREALPFADIVEVTEVGLEVGGGDAYAPDLDREWVEVSATDWLVSSSGVQYRYRTLVRTPE